MKIKSERDFWSGLVFLVSGVVFTLSIMGDPIGTTNQPGPGYFRLLPSLALATLGVIILFKALTFEHDGGDPIGHIAWRPLLVTVTAVAVFAASITVLGWVISVPILIGVSSLAGRNFLWKSALANAIALTLVSWLIFILGLKLNIPLGPRGWM